MAGIGRKAQGACKDHKRYVPRHTSRTRGNWGNAVEKAIETKLRQQARKACKSED